MELTKVYIQLGILFILMLIGYLLGKLKFFSSESNAIFSKFIVNVALPAVIISSMNIPLTKENMSRALYIFGLSIIVYMVTFIIAWFAPKGFESDSKQKGILSFMLMFSNCAFMGYPVLGALLGEEAIFYVAIYNICFNILVFTLGIKLLKLGNNQSKSFDYKSLLSPGIVATFIGLLLFITGIQLPTFISGSIEAVAGICTPLSMIVIGSMLSFLSLQKVFGQKKIYILAIIRLFLLPFIIFTLLKYILRIEDSWLVMIPVIVAGMPVASNAAMMAETYESDAELASQGVLITTLISCISIPLLIYIIPLL